MESPCRLTRALTANGLASSNKEAQRLIRQGAVTLDGDRAEDAFLELAPRDTPYELKVGKRRFLNLTVR